MRKVFLALLLFASLSLALPNCDSVWDGSKLTCGNQYGWVSQDPANSTGEFIIKASINATSYANNTLKVAFSFNENATPRVFEVWKNTSEQQDTLGWVTHSQYLPNVIRFINLSGSPIPCEVGETNEKNKQKYNITWLPNVTQQSQVFCFRNVTNQTPNYYVNWDLWEVNGTQNVQVEEWTKVTGWNTVNLNGIKWFYLQNINFTANETKQTRLTYEVKPNSIGKYDIILYPQAKGLAEAIEDGTFLFLDPWYNASYPIRVPLVVSNTDTHNHTFEALVFNLTAYKSYCNSNCTNIRVTMLNETGTEIAWNLFNVSSNYTNATGLAAGWVAPAPSNAELYLFTTANSTTGTNATVGYVYMNASGVNTWPATAQIYHTDFCDYQGWDLTAGYVANGTLTNGCYYVAVTNLALSSVSVGQTGGFLTSVVNFTDKHLAISSTDSNNWYTAYFEAGHFYVYRRAGGYTEVGANASAAYPNATIGFSYYPGGTKPFKLFMRNNTITTSNQILGQSLSVNNESAQTGIRVGYTGVSGSFRDLCYIYYPDDETQYCNGYAWLIKGAGATGVNESTGPAAGSLTIYYPTNATVNSPVNITYSATSGTNTTFPCNVTLDTTNILNETHSNATNTSFSYTITTGFHTLNVSCSDTSGFSAAQYFTVHAGLDVYVYDETNSTSITANLSITNGTVYNYNASHSFVWNWNETAQGDITITASNTSYYARSYYLTQNSATYTNLSIYLMPIGVNNMLTRFNIKNSQGNPVTNARVTIQKTIGSSWVTVGQQDTDSTGISAFYLLIGTTYYVHVQATGYTSYNNTYVISNPDYTITLSGGNTATNFTQQFYGTGISVLFTPNGFTTLFPPANNLTNVSFTLWAEASSNLLYSGFYVIYNGTILNWTNSTNSTYSNSVYQFNFSNTTNPVGNLTIIGTYKRTGFNALNITIRYGFPANYTFTNTTAAKGFTDMGSGLSELALGLIALLVSTIVAGWAIQQGGAPAGIGAAIICLGLFTSIGWISGLVFVGTVLVAGSAWYVLKGGF